MSIIPILTSLDLGVDLGPYLHAFILSSSFSVTYVTIWYFNYISYYRKKREDSGKPPYDISIAIGNFLWMYGLFGTFAYFVRETWIGINDWIVYFLVGAVMGFVVSFLNKTVYREEGFLLTRMNRNKFVSALLYGAIFILIVLPIHAQFIH